MNAISSPSRATALPGALPRIGVRLVAHGVFFIAAGVTAASLMVSYVQVLDESLVNGERRRAEMFAPVPAAQGVTHQSSACNLVSDCRSFQ